MPENHFLLSILLVGSSGVDRLIEIKGCWLNSSEDFKAKGTVSHDLFAERPDYDLPNTTGFMGVYSSWSVNNPNFD